jgi:polar amino acid transport system substrate-binding protein
MLIVAIVLLCGCGERIKGNTATAENLPKLKIGIDGNYEPYSYTDKMGNYAGLDIELAKEACKRMGYEPTFIAIKWSSKEALLADGTIDCVWSCFSMNGREDEYKWVGPYMYSRQVVAVTNDSDIYDFEDLNGKNVAVMSSTKPESIFLNRDGDDIPKVANVYCMDDMNLVFSALQLGYVDAAAAHETVIRQYMDTTTGSYRLLGEALLSAKIGIAFDINNKTDVPARLSEVMAEMEGDGTLEQALQRYGIATEANVGGEGQ